MENDIEYLFVYGTLRKGIELLINKQISKYVKWIGQAEIKGKLFDIGAYPGAIKLDDEEGESFIKGDVFKILDINVLSILDEYEGFDRENMTKSDYLRKQEIVDLNGKEIKVWVYWYNRSINGKYKIIQADFIEYSKNK